MNDKNRFSYKKFPAFSQVGSFFGTAADSGTTPISAAGFVGDSIPRELAFVGNFLE
jgi:hypothetical protein